MSARDSTSYRLLRPVFQNPIHDDRNQFSLVRGDNNDVRVDIPVLRACIKPALHLTVLLFLACDPPKKSMHVQCALPRIDSIWSS